MKNNDNLFYTCSLIEYIARRSKNCRDDIVKCLDADLKRIYSYADVFHCEPIEKVADDFMQRNAISDGNFDNLTGCKFIVPDYWDIGEVFSRLIEDCYEEKNVIQGIKEVYGSWLAERILNFNTDLYYQSREYLALCYKEGRIIPDQSSDILLYVIVYHQSLSDCVFTWKNLKKYKWCKSGINHETMDEML